MTTKHIFADSYEVTEDGETYWRIHCNSCQSLSINGVPCHETGCPQAWRDKLTECKNCETKFYPEYRHEQFCSDQCVRDYDGYPDLDEYD